MDQRQPGQIARSRSLFVPKTEWIEEDEVLILRVHLSGFSEKHIDCRIIAPSHYIRVCSDPELKNWHFNTLFEDIPEKFNLNEAKTKFDDGIFTIKVPKVIPAQISTGPSESEATTRREVPSLQESNGSKSGPQKSEDGAANQQIWTTHADKEITEAKDVEGVKGTSDGMSQMGRDQIPSKAHFPLVLTTRKLGIDDQGTVGQDGDQNAIENDKQKSVESVDQEKEGKGKYTEKSAGSVDQEKAEEAKDVEDASSSSSKPEKDNVKTAVTERRYMVDKYTIISVILAVGAYVFYNIYGQSRKKKSGK